MEGKKTYKKLMLIGSTSNPVHIKNYFELIKDYFDEIVIVGTHEVDFCKSYAIDFRIKNPIRLYKSIRQLRKLMLAFEPTFVHVHQANSFGYIAALANKKRYPHVLTTWGDDVLIFPHKNFIFKKLLQTSLKYADAITADAKIMEKAIHQFYGNVIVEIANFGIELQAVQITDKENIIYSNRLHENLYNIDKVIMGTSGFLKKHPDWKLVIAATGSNTAQLKSLAEDLNLGTQVEFVGFLKPEDNLRNYLRSKIYISIPDTDGTSISLLESMAYGCLPLLSDLPANKEWVSDGENGIIVHQNNIEEAIGRILQLDASSAIETNRKIIESRATKKSNREKFIAIYDRLLQQ